MPEISALVQIHGYWLLALVVLFENAGIPIPGETALLAAGYLTSDDGGHHLHLGLIILVAFVAAVIGDNLGFLLGCRVARRRLQAGRRFLFLTPERMKVAERYFEKYGSMTVFFARFITGLRVVAGPAAGASGMRWSRFLVANTAGAICWAIVIAFVGHYAGHAWEAIRERIGQGTWIVLGIGVLALVVWRVSRYFRKSNPPPANLPE